MGLFDSFTDMLEAALPWGEARAEAAAEEKEEDEKDSGEESKEEGDEEESKDDEPEEEEEEEDEPETEDPKEKFEEECKESNQCSPAKHHFDECVERVTGADSGKPVDKKHPDEDCVEEFFHLAHCANQCAAPKLWKALK